MEQYNSRNDTLKHIDQVHKFIYIVIRKLEERTKEHDKSKLSEPEKSIFDEYTPKLKDSTYMSDEYKQFLEEMKPALDHHYAENRHHPEHFYNGIDGMNIVDIIEMFCDWKAASTRHKDGNFHMSILNNANRFDMSEQLTKIFFNSVDLFKNI